MAKFEEILNGFAAKKPCYIPYTVEQDMLKAEVQWILLGLQFNPNVKRIKIWIKTNWTKNQLFYEIQIEKEDGTHCRNIMEFHRNYSPNYMASLKQWAKEEGLGVKYSPPDEKYPDGLLEIEHPAPNINVK